MNNRIIFVGPTCSGKTYIRDKFREKGFNVDVSWTSRPKRDGEEQEVDYYFTSREFFEIMIETNGFYEWIKYGDDYYGTAMEEWEKLSQVFIMETDGISKIKPKDRLSCLVIYVNTPLNTRLARMINRGWDKNKIEERIKVDEMKFMGFTDYDIEINSEAQILK